MNIFNKELIRNNNQLKQFLSNKKEIIILNIQHQKKLKDMCLCYLKKISDCLDNNVKTEYIDIFLKFLEDLKKSLKLSNDNINSLNDQLKTLDNILEKAASSSVKKNTEVLEDFYSNYQLLQNNIAQSSLQIDTFLAHVLDYTELKFLSNNNDFVNLTESNSTLIDQESGTKNEDNKDIQKNNEEFKITNDLLKDFPENTLIISETKNKIFLPYKLSDLEQIKKNKSKQYSDYKKILEEQYILPYKIFQNFPISRFKEAFKLMRNKEKKSMKEAFDLGMELLFNSNLHPAIISACRNIDELDIYLDCLENNETDEFHCFKIVFEMAPLVSKK